MSQTTLFPDQLTSFKENGFLVLRHSEHSIVNATDLQKWTQEVRSLPRENGKWMPYDEINSKGEKQLMRTENFVDYHGGFHDLLCEGELLDTLKQLSGGQMILFKDKINYKASYGNGFSAHLDHPAYDHVGKISHLTANLAVDAATPENGCLQVVPGSHLMEVPLIHGGTIDPKWEAEANWVLVPLEAGDILFFGSYLAHRSEKNTTDRSRASVYATYTSVADGVELRDKYYADRRENFPPDHERVAGKDYSTGVARYAFAAPFTNPDAAPAATETVPRKDVQVV